MKYQTIVQAELIERPNRFVAYVRLDGERVKVHVKNTGRCRELLRPGATVYLAKSDNAARSTAYDLVAAVKDGRTVNLDSQAPNKVVGEWLLGGELFPDLVFVRPETAYGQSRLDFCVETGSGKAYLEVKGVTLEEDGVARFPDAPSERAIKHLRELARAREEGYRACVIFVIQMSGVKYFLPNWETHGAFGEELTKAAAAGVELYAYECRVTGGSMEIARRVPVFLSEEEADAKFGKNSGNSNEKLRMGDVFAIPQPLLNWYDKNRRVLPWRETPTAYRVWVSEIMLQQTRVEAVKPYFERFMSAFPDVAALAAAEEETLLKLWEGLGYYSRARNLKRAAIRIMEDHGGRIPGDLKSLMALPGIGSYTAGAILSIAMGLRYPAVDGNVLRVLARVREDEGQVLDGKVKKAVERELSEVVPADRPGDFNQAMMELGARVCVPNGAPRCGECPLARLCAAHGDGVERDYPKKAAKRKRGIEEKTVLVIRDADRTALKKRDDGGLLAGLYEFPTLEGFCTAEEVAAYLAGKGFESIRVQPLGEAKHVFTHREWHMTGYMVRVDELEPAKSHDGAKDWIYIRPEEVRERYPIPTAFAAYAKALNVNGTDAAHPQTEYAQ